MMMRLVQGPDQGGRVLGMLRRGLIRLLASVPPTRVAGAAGAGFFLFDGDSIAAGQGATPGHGLAERVVALLGWTGRVHNSARSGRQMAECLALYGRNVAPYAAGVLGPKLLFIHAGDNDIRAGASGAAVFAAYARYVARARDQGWAVIASTKLARPTFPLAQRAELAFFNRHLLENTAGADEVIDFAAIPSFARIANRTNPDVFVADRVHPSDGGYAILARATAPVAARLLQARFPGHPA